MAYIGNLPATGQNNSFRLLDDITSYTLTFDGSSASIVNSSDKTIESANHRFIQGQRVVYTPGGTPVANLTGGTAYFIIKQGGSHFQLATSATNASNGVAISISAAGSSTSHTLVASFDAVNTRFMASHSGGTKVNITRSAQLNISINGVIQEPQETASPTAGFGRDSGSVIVFSTAPNAGDAFWGSLVADNVPTFDISDNDVDNFTGDDSTTDFTLSKTPPDNRNILVTLDGVTQHPSDNTTTRAYNVTENILSFTSAPNTSVSIQVRHIGFAGATGGGSGVTNFYGRTGSVVLKNTDTINVGNIVDEGYLAVGSTASFGGNVSIGGTLTYDDVTYVEAVGLSTFHEGINVIGISTFQNSLHLLDGDYLRIGGTYGSADGLNIYHASDHSYIDDAGTGNLYIRNGTKNSIFIRSDGEVILYNNDSSKFETTGYGVTVVGSMQVSGMTTFFNDTTIKNGGYHRGIINSGAQAKIIGGYISGTDTLRLGESMYLTSTGLGIGSITPGQDLHIYNSGYAGQIFQSQRTDYYDNIGGPLFHDHTGAVKAKVQSNVGGDLKFNSGGTDNRMVLVSTGQLGIGITNPEDYQSSSNDFVFGKTSNTGGMTIRSGTGNGGYIRFADGTSGNQAYRGTIAYLHDGDYMQLAVDSEEKLRITGAGITVTGEVAASQDYPNFRPTLDLNFAAEKKLDPRITYQRTGPASYYDEFGKVVLVGDNVPRFDYDPTTRESKGLLIEESRTNLFPYGTTPGDNWSGSKAGTFTENTTETTAPDGTFTATKWTFTNTDPYLYHQGTLSANTTYTMSMWVKAGTNMAGDWLQFRLGGAPYSIQTNSIIPADGTWRRITYTKTVGGSNETSVNIGFEPQTSPSGNPASGDVIYVWGAQLEVGSFVTSFIPTNGATATRGVDITQIDTDEFTEFYNDDEWTMVTHTNVDNSQSLVASPAEVNSINFQGDDNTKKFTTRYVTSSTINQGYVDVVGAMSGSSLYDLVGGGVGNYNMKTAHAAKVNDVAASFNGGTVQTDTSVTMLTGGSIMNIGQNPKQCHIKRIMYYSQRLPNTQLVTLTS